MHGRLKVKTSAEQNEAKRKEKEEKLKLFKTATAYIFDKREKKEFGEEVLKYTGRLLEQNADFYTLWNIRREILLHMKNQKTKDELQALALDELHLTQNCLKNNPKSYGAWHHRFWTMEFKPDPDWKKELKLCGFFLSMDERNFHCWDYRRLVAKKCQVAAEEELNFTTELIEKNFSNYSAWHYRSTLLPIIYPGSNDQMVDEKILLKEYELVQNAAFTDPNDQSVWFYHRWLLGRRKIPFEILCISVMKAKCKVIVLLSEIIKIDSNCKLILKIDGNIHKVKWKAINTCDYASSIWVCNLPIIAHLEKFELYIEVIKGKDVTFLSSVINKSQNFSWKRQSRLDIYRLELSAATKEVLERELESCQQLYEFEPDNKWTIFTSILLMRALNYQQYKTKISEFMQVLTEVDSSRKSYYKDLESKFTIENEIEQLPVEAENVILSSKKLSNLYHFDQLLLIKSIDLSHNYLTSIYPINNLIFVEKIILDDNQLTNFSGLEELENLQVLSAKKNNISEIDVLDKLKKCSAIRILCLEDNPIVHNSDFMLKKLSLCGTQNF